MTARTGRRSRSALFAVGFLGALTTLTSCSPDDDPQHTVVEARTRLVAAMSWQEMKDDPAGKTAMCESIAAFGPDWAAEQVVNGMTVETLADIDPRISVDFVTERCVQENLWPSWATSFPGSP